MAARRYNPITCQDEDVPQARKRPAQEVRISSVSFGSAGPRDFSTQMKDDFPWPADGRQNPAIVLKSTLKLGERDMPTYETETASKYGMDSLKNFSASKSVLPRNNHSCVDLGTEKCDFSTTMKDGFPPRQLDLASLRQNKDATAEVTRTHFILGDEPARFDTTYRSGMASEGVLREAAKTNAKKQDRYVLPKHGRFSSVPFGSGNDAGVEAKATYETTNAMPSYTEAEFKGAKAETVDPSSWASFGGSEAGSLTELYKTLTTSGKPLSAVTFGYDRPDFSTAAQESMNTKPHQVKLKEPYLPKIHARYCLDHPALTGTPSKKPLDGTVSIERE